MTRGISKYWRKNTSTSEATELANLLRALRKVAGHLGPNVGPIEYTGMSHGGGVNILLAPEMIMGRYPVPSEKVDYLVGLVTHEALHQIEWSDRVWRLLESVFDTMGGLTRVGFQKVIHVGEDIYVDHIADQKIFGFYVEKVRKIALEEARAIIPQEVLSIDELVYLWWATTWREESGSDREPAYQGPLITLNRLTRGLKEVSQSEKGVTARCKQRADLYCDTWQALEKEVSSWRIIDKTLYWYPSAINPQERRPEKEGKTRAAKAPLSPDLVEEIETQLAAHSVDITPVIRSVVGSDYENIVPTSRWDFNISAHPIIDRHLVSRLKAIFLHYAGRNKTISRGLLGGKVDARRLYRAPVSGRCFQQVDHIPDLDWCVTLLMDASGSMQGNKWRMVENTVANLHKALMGYRNRLQAYAYFESDGICMISQLIKGKQLLSVPPNGQTASGQAIIAAAYLMPKERKRNILIHITDGESNLGCDVQYGIDYCREQNIHLVTLGCGYKDREAMSSQYGKTLQFLDHFGQLPRAMECLLKWTFIYGTKPRLRVNQSHSAT